MGNASTAVRIDGQLVARARLRKGMTLREVEARCKELGSPISFTSLSRIECGKSQPTARCVPVLAEALGVEVDALFAEAA